VIRRPAVLIGLLLALVSCSRAERDAAPAPAGRYAPAREAQPSASPPAQAARVEGYAAPLASPAAPPPEAKLEEAQGGAVQVPRDRKLIRDANAQLQVKVLDEAVARLKSLAEASGGYVTNEQRSRDEHGVGRGSVIARVPAGKLDSLSAGLGSLGTVERFQVSANDITEEYFNLELQLRNRRQLEARLLELLKRPANKLSDLLDAERELARVRNEIDQMEGRQRFWDNRVSLSTLTVEVHEPEPAVAGNQGGAWAALKHSFSEAADNFVLAIAGIISVSGGLVPIVVAVAIVVWLLVKWWRWRRRQATRTAA
jgi:hypothetical protein